MLCSQYGRTVNGRGPQAGRLRSLSFPIERRIPDYRLPTGCYVHIRCVYTAVLDGATSRTDTVGVLPGRAACGAAYEVRSYKRLTLSRNSIRLTDFRPR